MRTTQTIISDVKTVKTVLKTDWDLEYDEARFNKLHDRIMMAIENTEIENSVAPQKTSVSLIKRHEDHHRWRWSNLFKALSGSPWLSNS